MNGHLVSLYLVLEKGFTGARATQAIGQVLEYRSEFEWLEPPVPNGHITVVDVFKARDLTEHKTLVEQWARDVWNAWSAHHDVVQNFVRKCKI